MSPLSWSEARSLLHDVLEEYLRNPCSPPVQETSDDRNKTLLSKCIHFNLDLGLTLLISLLFLLIVSLTESVNRYNIVASVLLVATALGSVGVALLRSNTSRNDSEVAKQREIKNFLWQSKQHMARPSAESPSSAESRDLPALTGVYPVFRRRSESQDDAAWSKIPSLLLMKGDWIALQVGDVSPASVASLSNQDVVLQAGERYTADAISPSSALPRGRTTLSNSDTDHLLALCNQMHVFCVTSPPLKSFLLRPTVLARSSRAARQIQAIRQTLLLVSLIVFVLTAAVTFSRSGTYDDMAATLPILAALGALPVVGPAFLFFLEVLGTARILVAVHPYASKAQQKTEKRLLLRYIFAVILSRLSLGAAFDSLHHRIRSSDSLWSQKLVRVPPTSIHLLENLGVATAFCLVDDELICDPQAIPQQLLVPSGKGLKLLDLCQAYDDDDDEKSSSTDNSDTESRARGGGKSFDSDSESEDGTRPNNFQSSLRRTRTALRRLRRPKVTSSEDETGNRVDVQFEEPNWWQYLPSLKCIGLACMLLEDSKKKPADHEGTSPLATEKAAKSSLVSLACNELHSTQLRSLAECIGFSATANSFGERGDISPFVERLRLHVLSHSLVQSRLQLDAHERSSDQSRWWGLIRPDSTSVIVQDNRTKAFQLLTVGDPSLVSTMCQEAWQGEISTILPLAAIDRQTILETAENWKLADLDVAAFSYTPVPYTLESSLTANSGSHLYLLDHASSALALVKDKNISSEWSFVKNQIFLGVLASLVRPRQEISSLLEVLDDAGVRFVYFSPRNMRRQKELAIQMGIDVAWNCAISLRPLEHGEEEDPHRMVSAYADWDVKAKLPHGVEDVRRHLEEVDNVPLLVSLFTDSTKQTTKEMVEIFQDYNDTVVSVGISHLTRNESVFSSSNVAVGIDILSTDEQGCSENAAGSREDALTQPDLDFVSAIASHACAFRFCGDSSVANISTVVQESRASLDAAVSGGVFFVTGSLSFSLYVLFSSCLPSKTIPFVPALGCAVYLQLLLPFIGLAMAMGDHDKETMKKVPPKNDKTITFTSKEQSTFYATMFVKAALPAFLPQFLHLVAFGELVIRMEPEHTAASCRNAKTWLDIVWCDGIRDPDGEAWATAGSLVFGTFVLCTLVASSGFVHRFQPFQKQRPWEHNRTWVYAVICSFGALALYFFLVVEKSMMASLPWYFFATAAANPFLCFLGVEFCKRTEIRHENRAAKLRRLQFETRLGAWSPR